MNYDDRMQKSKHHTYTTVLDTYLSFFYFILFYLFFLYPSPSLSIYGFLSLSSLTTNNHCSLYAILSGHHNHCRYAISLLLRSQRHHHPSRLIHSDFPHHHRLSFLFRPLHNHRPSPQIHRISHITKHHQDPNRRFAAIPCCSTSHGLTSTILDAVLVGFSVVRF